MCRAYMRIKRWAGPTFPAPWTCRAYSIMSRYPKAWKEYCKEQKKSRDFFPAPHQCTQYMRISQYPGAYESGMSVKEAYKMATAWKKNGGQPPIKSKLTIKTRLPNQIGKYVGKAMNRLEQYNQIEDWSEQAVAEKWDEDDFAGMEETLMLCRQEVNHSLRKLKTVKESVTYE